MYQQSFKRLFWVLPGNFTFQLFLPITDAVDSGVCGLDDVESFSHGVEDIEDQLNLFLVGLTCTRPQAGEDRAVGPTDVSFELLHLALEVAFRSENVVTGIPQDDFGSLASDPFAKLLNLPLRLS